MTERLRFRKGGASAEELQGAVDEALADLGGDAPEGVTVADEHGADPLTVTIIVTILGNLGSHAAIQAWDRIWPRVQDKLGDDALGEQQDDD
jgi:hypothetical protein